jgi:hypothetical protein
MASALSAIRKFKKIPCRRLVNHVIGLTVFQRHGHAACSVRGVNLQVTRIDGQRVQDVDRLPAQVVAPNPAQNGGVVAEPARHHRKIRGSSAQLRPPRQHIPQQLTNPKDQTRRFHGRAPIATHYFQP